MIVGEPDNKKILFFQEIAKRIHLHSNCEKIKFLGQFGVRSAFGVMQTSIILKDPVYYHDPHTGSP